jgi:phage terminase large subunit
MARSRAERESADLQALSAKLSQSGDIKDAVALYKARLASRR